MSLLPRALGRLRAVDPQLRLFLAGMVCLGVAGGIFETTFNNFLHEVHRIGETTRGALEMPRELPGFLTALLAGALFFLPETLIAAGAALAVAAGMFGLAAWGVESWSLTLLFMIVWSTGTHVMMPVRASVSIDLAEPGRKGARLGQVAGVGTAAVILGCVVVWVGMKHLGADYRVTFAIGGLAALGAAAAFHRMRLPGAHLRRPRFVWRRRYGLYYVLALLFGARKQIFITFGPWVLVKIFDQPAWVIAKLWLTAAALGVVLQPLLGRAIDRIGERLVLQLDSLLVFLICIGYGFAHLALERSVVLYILYACFVGDQLLFGVNMARSTYLAGIAERQEDVSPSLSMGVTINHAVSMVVPFFGGLLWAAWGHSAVFTAAAGVALLMFLASGRIRRPAA